MLLHIFQGDLENPVEGQFCVGGQPPRQLFAGEGDDPAGAAGKLGARLAEGRRQPQLIEHARPQVVGDALHFFDGVAEHVAQCFRLGARRTGASRQAVHERLAAKLDGAEQLGDVVMEFERHAAALGLLHLHDAFGQGPQLILAEPGRRHIRHDDAQGRSVGPRRGQRAKRDLHRHF